MPASSPTSVLVVDDDTLSLALHTRYLANSEFKVLTARDGAEALRLVLAEGPSIVLTDWIMPEMDGLELCRAIRTHEGIGYTYVMIITARNEDNAIVSAFEAGADDYIAKPFERYELLARLRAGQRNLSLHDDLEKERREIHRVNAEMAVAHDKLADANKRLHYMATVDELTDLTNRREALRMLGEHWENEFKRTEPLACVMLDIDHFKQFNDSHGHDVGDQVLRTIARTMRKAALKSETVCRLGGEEFLILCPGGTEDDAAQTAERCRAAVEALTLSVGDLELSVTISAGVAERTGSTANEDELIKAADGALYAAKHAGRNRVCRAGQPSVAVTSVC